MCGLYTFMYAHPSTTFAMIRRLSNWMFNRDLFAFILKILYIVGLWPDEQTSRAKRWLYTGYEFLIHFLTLIYDVIATIGIYTHKDDTLVVAECLDKTLVAYNATVKVILFMISRNQLQRLLRDIRASGDTVSTETDRSMTKLIIFLFATGTSVITLFAVLSVMDSKLAVEAWFPFDATKSRMTALYGNEMLAVVFLPNIWRMIAMQGLYSCLVMYLCEQLKDLQARLRGLDYSREREGEMRREFGEIVKKHCRTIGYVQAMSKGFKYMLFVQNLVVTIELCLNAFMVAMIETNERLRLLNFGTFLFVTLFNAYVYCYLGNELIIQSENLAQAAYSASWTSWPKDLQKDLLTMIICSQRPLLLKALVSVMSLRTYSTIVYNGYSIFAMLYDVAN